MRAQREEQEEFNVREAVDLPLFFRLFIKKNGVVLSGSSLVSLSLCVCDCDSISLTAEAATERLLQPGGFDSPCALSATDLIRLVPTTKCIQVTPSILSPTK
jgi:hypothetical protein